MYRKRNANSIQPSHKLAATPPLLQSASNKGLGFQAKIGLLFASGLLVISCHGRWQNSYDRIFATAPHGPRTAEWRQRPVPASSWWRHLYLKTQDSRPTLGVGTPAIDMPLSHSWMGYFHTPFGWVKGLSTALPCVTSCPSTAIKTPRA